MNDKCVLCGSHNIAVIHKGTRDNDRLNVLRCNACGLCFLDSFEHITNAFYEDSNMYQNKKSVDIKQMLKTTQKDDVRRSKFLEEMCINRKVCDFGCGFGGFMSNLNQGKGIVKGVELESIARNYDCSLGFDVRSSLEDFDEKFDIITMFHVIEHIVNPKACIGNIAEHLEEAGKLVIETPNADDALITMYDCEAFKDFTYWSPHVILYTLDTLKILLEECGFKETERYQIQRYPLTNHLYWLSHGFPGGDNKLTELNDENLFLEYEKMLRKLGKCDTILSIFQKN